MRNFEEYRSTTNRYVYNRIHKELHASCSHCSWHQKDFGHYSENGAWKWYSCGAIERTGKQDNFPNWKLVSKNKKQWMKKPLKFENNSRFSDDISDITWKI